MAHHSAACGSLRGIKKTGGIHSRRVNRWAGSYRDYQVRFFYSREQAGAVNNSVEYLLWTFTVNS